MLVCEHFDSIANLRRRGATVRIGFIVMDDCWAYIYTDTDERIRALGLDL